MSKTLENGSFQDAVGTVVNAGTIEFVLSHDAMIIAGGQVAPTRVSATLDSSGDMPSAFTILANDELTPSGTFYLTTVFDSNGARVFGPERWVFSGASPIDLDTLTPTIVDPAFANPILSNPVAAQAIEGFNFTMPLFNNVRVVDGTKFAATGVGIQAAVDDLPAAGGVVFIPAGTYTITDTGANAGITLPANTYLFGAGPNATILKLGNSEDVHTINTSGTSNVGIFNLTIDGNRANQTVQVHGIRSGGVSSLWLSNLEIKECEHYGIGLQSLTNERIYFSNLHIHDVGADGIDFKNTNDDNDAIFLNNIKVADFGLNGTLSTQAGIDIRGPATLSNIFVSGFPSDGTGIRFRAGALLDANGFGGHRSSLSNFDIRASAVDAQIGVGINSDDVKISNGYMLNLFRGLNFSGNAQRPQISNVTCEECTIAYRVSDGDFISFSNAVAFRAVADASTRGFRFSTCTNVTINNSQVSTNDIGILVDATATDTRILGGVYTDNTTALSDSGTSTFVRDAIGLAGVSVSDPLEGTLSNMPHWIFKQVDHTDMTAGATADTFTLWTLPANTMIHDVVATVVTAWAGTGPVSAAVASVGTTGGGQ